MAAKTKAPRPGKNSDGQKKGKANPPKDDKPTGNEQPPGVNPRTHAPAGGAPPAGPAAPGAGMQMQSRQTINYKDLPPAAQSQVQAQQGIDPNAAVGAMNQQLQSSLAQGPSQGPVPNQFAGPGSPPGTESFPDDMAQLTQLMQQGLGPGSSPQEHQLGINAEAIVRAHDAFKRAQNGAAEPSSAPQLAATMAPPVSAPPPVPEQPQQPMVPPPPGPGMLPGLNGAPAAGPPMDPNAPGGIPPEIIAALGNGEDPRKRKRR